MAATSSPQTFRALRETVALMDTPDPCTCPVPHRPIVRFDHEPDCPTAQCTCPHPPPRGPGYQHVDGCPADPGPRSALDPLLLRVGEVEAALPPDVDQPSTLTHALRVLTTSPVGPESWITLAAACLRSARLEVVSCSICGDPVDPEDAVRPGVDGRPAHEQCVDAEWGQQAR